jgi:uncharacterized membrane protein
MASVFVGFALTSFVHTVGIILERNNLLPLAVSIRWRFLGAITFGIFFVIAGIAHFDGVLTEKLYLPMMPPFIPYNLRRFMNTLAGIIETIIGFASLIFAVTQSHQYLSYTALASLLVLFAVFPANIYVAMSPRTQNLIGHSQEFANVRLLIQVTFALWAAWPLLQIKGVRSSGGVLR